MNKYRNITPTIPAQSFVSHMNPGEQLPVPRDSIPTEGLMDKGIVLFRSAQDIELDQSPDLSCVRVFESGLGQDFDLKELGAATPLDVLALGEHKFVLSGASLFERTFRLYRKANTFIRIESWDGVTWNTEFDGLDWVIDAVLLSWKTYFAEAFFADGTRVTRWKQVTSLVAQVDEFTAANSLTAVGNTVDATISPAVAYLEKYAVHYDLTLTGPCVGGSFVEVEILRGTLSIVTINHPIPATSITGRVYDLAHEIANIVATIAASETLTLKLKTITALPHVVKDIMAPFGSTPRFRVTKSRTREAQGDNYTFTFDIDDSESGQGSFVEFYFDSGAGFVLIHNATKFFAGNGHTKLLSVTGMGAGDRFGIQTADADQGTVDIVGTPFVEWGDAFDENVVVHGFNKATDGDDSEGVVYEDEGTPVNDVAELDQDPAVTPSTSGTSTSATNNTISDTGNPFVAGDVGKFIKITGGPGALQLPRRITVFNSSSQITVGENWTVNPTASAYEIYTPILIPARYLGVFADRLIFLQADGDPQKISFSRSGLPADGVGLGSGSSIRDSRSDDPVDELLALEPLSSNVAILFRRRSLERVTQTGTDTKPLGFFPWIQNLGTESPFSVTKVPGGIVFLGHDKQVYFLTDRGPQPISVFIQEELEDTIGDLSVVEGEYDPTTQNFILAVPGLAGKNTAVIWTLDFGRFIAEQVVVWQRRNEVMNRLAIVEGRDIIFVGSDGVVRQFDKTVPCTNAYWASPMLNRANKNAQYSLVQVVLRYQAASATTLVVEASDDGGVTYKAGYNVTVALAATNGDIRRVVQGFNITGYDLRFRITYPTGVKVTIRNWRADLVERGDLGGE